MRTGVGSSQFAARRRIVIAAVSVTLALGASVPLAGCGEDADGAGGAPAPARPGTASDVSPGGDADDAAAGRTPPAGSAGPSASGTATGTATGGGPTGRDDSPAGAGRVVEAYFSEINAAATAGRVADVAAAALSGCQTCAHDVGMTRYLDQTGARAASAPYTITGLRPDERRGTVVDVRFTATVRDVRLLDPAGRDAGVQPGVPSRSAVARLLLTGPGWRIQNITYAPGPAS